MPPRELGMGHIAHCPDLRTSRWVFLQLSHEERVSIFMFPCTAAKFVRKACLKLVRKVPRQETPPKETPARILLAHTMLCIYIYI